MNPALRVALSALAALTVVAGLSFVAVAVFFERPPVYRAEAFRVSAATPAERAAALADAPTPPVSAPLRTGFVQLRYVVTPDGQARDIEVLAAVPPGYHEAAAIALVERERHAPGIDRGVAVAREATRIVEFTYTPR